MIQTDSRPPQLGVALLLAQLLAQIRPLLGRQMSVQPTFKLKILPLSFLPTRCFQDRTQLGAPLRRCRLVNRRLSERRLRPRITHDD